MYLNSRTQQNEVESIWSSSVLNPTLKSLKIAEHSNVMAAPSFNSKSPTIKRILKEAAELSAHPDPALHAAPLESNLFEWHFTLQGPPSTPYSAGVYHGRIVLPPTYPLRPPSFRFLTPSGRFEVNREICLSISGHHEETWQPAWGIRTALWALRAFMEGDARGQVGGMEMPEKERARLAEASKSWKCQSCGGKTNEAILKEASNTIRGEYTSNKEIPKELKFGFRDEMAKEKSSELGHATANAQRISTGQADSSTDDHAMIPAAPAVKDLASNNTQQAVVVPAIHRTTRAQQPLQSRNSPAWLDRAITGLVAALAIMVLKKLVT